MDYTVIVGGRAGDGVAQAAETLGKTLTRLGFYVFNYRDYPSLIRGGHNFNVISFSKDPINSHREKTDVIIALNQETIKLHSKKLKKDGIILCEKGINAKKSVQIDSEKILEEIKAPKIIRSSIFLGVLMKYFGHDLKPLNKIFSERHGKFLGLNMMASKRGYDELKGKVKKIGKGRKGKRYFLTGNQGISLGSIKAGLDMYIAYPMTPATPVLHFLAQKQIKHDMLVMQMENEIAVVNAALGASFTGAKAMVGTSGGGFALMGETLSMQGIAETPLTVYLSQRTAPGTGVPTYSTQGDLKFALNVGHGDFPRVVVAPGDAAESYKRTAEAIYLAEKYRLLSIIISDKHIGESHYTFDNIPKLKKVDIRNIIKPKKDFKIYKLTKNGMSPRSVPQMGEFVRATSYEHDEHGYTIEDPEMTKKMNDKRYRKWKFAEKEIMKMEPLTIYGKGRTTIISWGSTKGAILDTMRDLRNVKFVQINYISPFPSKQISKILKSSKKVILVENNVTGQLGDVIAEKTGFMIKNKVLKYDSRPLTKDWLLPKLRRLVK